MNMRCNRPHTLPFQRMECAYTHRLSPLLGSVEAPLFPSKRKWAKGLSLSGKESYCVTRWISHTHAHTHTHSDVNNHSDNHTLEHTHTHTHTHTSPDIRAILHSLYTHTRRVRWRGLVSECGDDPEGQMTSFPRSIWTSMFSCECTQCIWRRGSKGSKGECVCPIATNVCL